MADRLSRPPDREDGRGYEGEDQEDTGTPRQQVEGEGRAVKGTLQRT
ncbi:MULTISPECIES: hypothetical protein [unclassified Egicoccus]